MICSTIKRASLLIGFSLLGAGCLFAQQAATVIQFLPEDSTTSGAQAKAQAKTLGKQGFALRGAFEFAEGTYAVYSHEPDVSKVKAKFVGPMSGDLPSGDFIAKANALGSNGFGFPEPLGLPGFSMQYSDGLYYLFEKQTRSTGNSVFQSQAVSGSLSGDSQTVVAQVKSLNKQGYEFYGLYNFPDGPFNLYQQEAVPGVTRKIKSKFDPVADGETSAAFLAAVNARGATGYRQRGQLGFSDGSYRFFEQVKLSTGKTTYQYAVDAAPASNSVDDYTQLLNARAMQSYSFAGEFFFADGDFLVFEQAN